MDPQNNNFKVAIQCSTYNHEKYIEDALGGFVMQETNFPFVAIVVDDASTDNEPQVLWNFINNELEASAIQKDETEDYVRVFAPHKSNQNCTFAIYFLKYNHYSIKKTKAPYLNEWQDQAEYIAFCEGDDYWTDSAKLQKQTAFLDSHTDYIMCSHDFYEFFQKTKSFKDKTHYEDIGFKEENGWFFFDYSLDNYFKRWYTHPLSCVYRNGSYLQEIPVKKYRFYKDRIFYYYVLKQGKGALLKDNMGVYRIHDGGTYSGIPASERYYKDVSNGYELYKFEKDERALEFVQDYEIRRFKAMISEGYRKELISEIFDYFKIVPVNVFFKFLRFVVNHLKKKIINSWRK